MAHKDSRLKKKSKPSSDDPPIGPPARTRRRSGIAATSRPRSKGEFFGAIADATGMSKKQVAAVFDAVGEIIATDLAKGHVVNVGGLMKVTVSRRPPIKEREGINPFTGEKQTFKAKPARKVVKIRPLKALKDQM